LLHISLELPIVGLDIRAISSGKYHVLCFKVNEKSPVLVLNI